MIRFTVIYALGYKAAVESGDVENLFDKKNIGSWNLKGLSEKQIDKVLR